MRHPKEVLHLGSSEGDSRKVVHHIRVVLERYHVLIGRVTYEFSTRVNHTMYLWEGRRI
jgi:hypothetical protein